MAVTWARTSDGDELCGALRPLLDQFGNERELTIILFTLDESAYSRELGPLAGTIRACGWGRRGGS